MRLDDAVSWFLGELRLDGRLAPATVKTYARALTHLARYAADHGKPDLEQLDRFLVRQAVVALTQPSPNHAPNYKGGEALGRLVVIAAQKLAARLQAEGVAVQDLSGVKRPRVPERVQPRVKPSEYPLLTHAVMARLIRRRATLWLVARDLALLCLLTDTALRAFEVSALDTEHLALDTGIITVHRGKGLKPRYVSILDPEARDREGGPTVRAMADYLRLRAEACGRTDGPLFLSYRYRRMNPDELRKALNRICQKAGLTGNRPPHAFRRTWFTEAYQENPLALPVLVQRMGWSPKSRDLVETYTRGAELDLAAAAPVPLLSKRFAQRQEPPGTVSETAEKLRKPPMPRGW